jgi:hypothetical protein
MTSTIKVNNVQNQCGQNIINENSNTITLGASGDTIALASGASQTGFGRTGTVDWETTPKTSTFTGVSGKGYFINQGSAITCNLPAGTAGDIISFSDYARNFATYNFTVNPNGSEKIGGIADDAKLAVDGQAATFVYVDATKGWINIQNAEDTETGVLPYVAATGGTVLTNGDFKTHIFTGPGTFCVSNAGGPGGSNTVDYLVVAGGGSGGYHYRGSGGGAGGFRVSNSVGCVPAPTMSPLIAPAALPVSVQAYPITVGAGGSGPTSTTGNNGANSIFSSITSAGGGAGANCGPTCVRSQAGGSGGGRNSNTAAGPGSAGNTPPVSPPQGNAGGSICVGAPNFGAGGGGAGAAGGNSTTFSPRVAAPGGAGSYIADTFIGPTAPSYGTPGPVSSTRYFAGGGGGGVYTVPTFAPGGAGGGGKGGYEGPGPTGYQNSANGTANTGGGGGGGAGPTSPSCQAGGSGIVMIRYKFQ